MGDIYFNSSSLASGKVKLNGTEMANVYFNGSLIWTYAQYITATGGTITTDGDYKVHRFTGSGTFQVTSAGNAAGSNSVDYLVVAGGGYSSGAGGWSGTGGGGAGGYRTSYGSGNISGGKLRS